MSADKMQGMQLIYIINAKMPTQKAHGIHVAKMCESFAKEGIEVNLVVPTRNTIIKDDPYTYYSVERNFKIVKIFSIDLIPIFPWIGYWFQYISFSIASVVYLIIASRKKTIIYTREYLPAFIFKKLGFFTIYEAHRVILKNRIFFSLVKKSNAIVTNSKGVAKEFYKRGFANVMAYPNGVDLKNFEFNIPKSDLRRRLALPENKKIVMYTGHLYNWKGIDTIFKAIRAINNEQYKFVFVGGTESDIKKYSRIAKEEKLNAIFISHVINEKVPFYLRSADVLLLPNSKISEESVKYTSPIKLFEYMASNVPIVASDLPSIREILNEENAILFESDNAEDLIRAINEAIYNPEKTKGLAEKAYSDVLKFTWQRRAEEILSFVLTIYESRQKN